ncbi:MAG: hypothetical protein LBK99_03985 [Opitutaceae bacterium]|nr:hypothetical protein [Opitutaceae bacterium]
MCRPIRLVAWAAAFSGSILPAQTAVTKASPMSLNSEVIAVPAPEGAPVVIDGNDNDWDLSAGVWSYNSPDIVDTYSVWTHLMWDQKGLYYLARIRDDDPMKNAASGIDFARSWQGDAVQLRVIFDDRTGDEHQMHMNLYYSSPDKKPWLIVRHGGMKNKPPYDRTGPARPDLQARFGETPDAAGGRIAMRPWDDGRGYNMEVFLPWTWLRLGGAAPKPGDAFVFGWETLWAPATPAGKEPETGYAHRLADGVKDASTNRIFMFRARDGWGRAVIAEKGGLDVTENQRQLQREKLAALVDFTTKGSIPIRYSLPAVTGTARREVTIAIEDASGRRVRNLFGQYPREGDTVTDYWDGLDDSGKPVPAGRYTAIVLDHEPIGVKLFSTLYNAGTPPWVTSDKNVNWGSDHGAPAAIASQGERVIVAFSLPEAGVGLDCYRNGRGLEWSSRNSAADMAVTDDFIYTFEYDMWVSTFKVSRIDLASGRLVPFDGGKGGALVSRELALKTPATAAKAGASASSVIKGAEAISFAGRASIAAGKNALWLLTPDAMVCRMDMETAAISEERPAGGLISLRSRNGKIYGIFNDNGLKSLWSLTGELQREKRLLDLSAMEEPRRFGVSGDASRFAICDAARNQVFIYQLASPPPPPLPVVIGKPKPGEARAGGRFDRDDIMAPASVDFDNQGRAWIAEATWNIHRTSVWNPDGSFADEFFGATPYGATHGFVFPHDATRFIAMGLEFRIDPAIAPHTRKSAEVPLFFHPQLAKTQGQIHRVAIPGGGTAEFAIGTGSNAQGCLLIYRRDSNGEFIPAAGVFGKMAKRRLQRANSYPQVIAQLPDAAKPRAWTDRNGNGKIDTDELTDLDSYTPLYWSSGWVRPDMSILTPDMRLYPLKGCNEHGVPLYDFSHPAPVPNPIVARDAQGATGTPVMDSAGNITDGIRFHTTEGRRGAWPNPYGRHDAPGARRGVLIAPFRTNGVVEGLPGIGSATMLQGDRGQWFLMSIDGLFISSLFQDLRGIFTMDETIIGGESFGGHFWRVTDGPMKGKVLLQTGKVVYSIFEVLNLDTLRRRTVALDVSAGDIRRGTELAAAQQGGGRGGEAPLVITTVERLPESAPEPALRRETALAPGCAVTLVEEANNPSCWFKVSLLTDRRELAAVWEVSDPSPWKNGADRFTHAFAGGDAVDLKLDSPGLGAIRLLAAPLGGKPQAVFWQKKAAMKENAQVYAVGNNPRAARAFDIVRVLSHARIDVKTTASGYTVLLRVPLADLGLDGRNLPEAIAGVAGVIFSDAAGTDRVARLYWHDKQTGMVNDVPTESDIVPSRFGKIRVIP